MTIEATKAFQPELYRSYLGICARICGRKADYLQGKLDASDLVQEALLQACVALPQFHGSTERQFTAWLREILENKLLDKQKHFGRAKRDAKREQALAETWRESSTRFGNRFDKIAVDQTSPSQRVAHHEKARLLAEALGALPEDQRTALELHHIEDQSLTETARLMNRTAASVAGLLRRGLKAMRDNLKDRESELR